MLVISQVLIGPPPLPMMSSSSPYIAPKGQDLTRNLEKGPAPDLFVLFFKLDRPATFSRKILQPHEKIKKEGIIKKGFSDDTFSQTRNLLEEPFFIPRLEKGKKTALNDIITNLS